MHDLSELTTHCIRCGFCLESCPTFVLTGQETESPRGRIYLSRSAQEGVISWQDAAPHLDACLGCRACETACPSGVEYGKILELAREQVEALQPKRARHLMLTAMTQPGLMRLTNLMAGIRLPEFVSEWITDQAPQTDLPETERVWNWPELATSDLPPVRGQVLLLEGCAMRALFPNVHVATRRLLRRVGYEVRETQAGCCGALHAHSGFLQEAENLSNKLIEQMPGSLPIIVNSAGCGSTMKEYGDLLDTEKAAKFSSRVKDISEFLVSEGLEVALAKTTSLNQAKVTYHDACHLAHGQRIKNPPRDLLAAIPGIDLVPLFESDMCCGSAGTYNLTQPDMARKLLDRKWTNIEQTGAKIVVMGNPGCHAWLRQASKEHGGLIRVLHTAEFLEGILSGLLPLTSSRP